MTDNSKLHGDLASILVRRYRMRKRSPNGSDKALENLNTAADQNSTQKIILGQSKEAWKAYYAGIRESESEHGFAGRAELRSLLDNLNAQPIEQRRAFAIHLASELESEEVNIPSPGVNRRRTAYNDAEASPQVTRDVNSRPSNLDLHISEHGSSQAASPHNICTRARLKPAQELFQEQFWESVRRISAEKPGDPWFADISMVLHEPGHTLDYFGCQMLIGIVQNKVADLAYECFGVKVEITDGVRSLLYPGGSKIDPDPSIRLQACQRDLSGLFRGDLYEAACTSPIYQREENEARHRTDGVSLTMSNRAEEDAKLSVYLGQWKALAIRATCYGS